MSTAVTATAELKALAEALAKASKEVESAKAATKAAAAETQNYSAALHASAIIAEREAAAAYKAAAAAVDEYENRATTAANAAAKAAQAAAQAQAQAANAAAQAQAKATKEQESKLKDLSNLLAKAFSDEMPEKLNDARAAYDQFNDKSNTTGQRARALFAAVSLGSNAFRLGASSVLGYAQSVVELSAQTLTARVNMERLREQGSATALAMAELDTATGHAATAQDALVARTALLDNGLMSNAHAVAQVVQFSREHRRAGEENADTVRRVVAAIRGNAEAQAELGITVAGGSTALEAQVQVMRQLEAANRAATPSAQSAAERQQQVAQGMERFKAGALATLGALTGLGGIYEGLADGANVLGNGLATLTEWWRGTNTEQQRAQQLAQQEAARQQQLLRQQQAQQQAREATLRGLRQEIALRTAQSAVETSYAEISAQVATVQQVLNERTEQQARLARRYGESEEEFLRRQLEGLGQIASARQQLLQLAQQQEQERRASDEVAIQATTLRNLGLQVSSQLRGLTIQQSYNGLLREARDLRRSELETQTQFEARAATTLQALEAARQRVIQDAQAQQAARDARFGLGRSVRDARDAGVPGFKGFEGVAERTASDEYARIYADAFSRRRMGESAADYDNRRSASVRRLLEIQQRNTEAEMRARETRREFESMQTEPMSAVDDRTAAIGASNNAFAEMRAGVGSSLANRIRERQAFNSLEQTNGGSEGNLNSLISSLEQQAQAFLARGGDENARRAAAIREEAQAVSNAIDSYRELAQTQREAADVGMQFEQRWIPAAERTRTMAQRMAEFSVSAFQQFSNALVQHLIAVSQGQETFGEGMRAVVHDAGLAIAQMAGNEALMEGARAVAAVAKGIGGNPLGFAEAAAHGAAAAAYLGIAAAGGIAAAVTSPPATAASAAASASTAPAVRSGETANGGGSVTIVNNYTGLLTMKDAGRVIVDAQREAARNGHRLDV